MAVGCVTIGCTTVLGGVLGAGFEEGLENRVGLLEVVVDDVDETVRVHDAVDQLA